MHINDWEAVLIITTIILVNNMALFFQVYTSGASIKIFLRQIPSPQSWIHTQQIWLQGDQLNM